MKLRINKDQYELIARVFETRELNMTEEGGGREGVREGERERSMNFGATKDLVQKMMK